MDKLLAKMALPSADFDMLFGMNVWAVGRSIAAGQIRPFNHDYLTNFTNNVWDQFQSPFYDVGRELHAPVQRLEHGDLLAQRSASASTRRP